MKYLKKPIELYLKDLGRKKPVPGGGSAAALVGSLGAGLLMMVAAYTIGKKKYKKHWQYAEKVYRELAVVRDALNRLIDEDIRAYENVSKVRQSKDDRSYQRALKEASQPPFSVCELTAHAMTLAGGLKSRGNANLISDTRTGMGLLREAFKAARLNVDINLKYIHDKDYRKKVNGKILSLEKKIKNNKV
jgi:formiminotetrahydrofolate cyclodeaminase